MNSKKSNETVALEKLTEMQQELCCSVCYDYFVQPITLNCSHSFCHGCIKAWRENHNDCPCCRQEIFFMTPSLALDNMVTTLLKDVRLKTFSKENLSSHSTVSVEPDSPRMNHSHPLMETDHSSDTDFDYNYFDDNLSDNDEDPGIFERNFFGFEISTEEWPEQGDEFIENEEVVNENGTDYLEEELNSDNSSYDDYEGAEDIDTAGENDIFQQDSEETYSNNSDYENDHLSADCEDVYKSDCDDFLYDVQGNCLSDDYNNDYTYISNAYDDYHSDFFDNQETEMTEMCDID